LAEYESVLAPQLAVNTQTLQEGSAQAEETTDLERLDQLSVRIRSLELREKALSGKAAQSEKWMQTTLALHVERAERLSRYWDELRARESFGLLRKHFPNSSFDPELEKLALQTTMYTEGQLKVPLCSYSWQQPLTPFSYKVMPPNLAIVDPLFAPPKR